jgi:hypothetical protein
LLVYDQNITAAYCVLLIFPILKKIRHRRNRRGNENVGLDRPLVVRPEGTNVNLGKKFFAAEETVRRARRVCATDSQQKGANSGLAGLIDSPDLAALAHSFALHGQTATASPS